MTEHGLEALITAMSQNDALADQMGAATTAAEFIDIASSHGYVLTHEDLSGSLDELPLSDSQLELISGGGGYDDFVNDVTSPILEPAKDISVQIGREVGLG